MRARDLPGGSRGSVVLLWCCQSCAILQGDTPRPHPTTKGLKAQLAPSVTYSVAIGYVWPPCWRWPKSETARNHDDGKSGDVLK